MRLFSGRPFDFLSCFQRSADEKTANDKVPPKKVPKPHPEIKAPTNPPKWKMASSSNPKPKPKPDAYDAIDGSPSSEEEPPLEKRGSRDDPSGSRAAKPAAKKGRGVPQNHVAASVPAPARKKKAVKLGKRDDRDEIIPEGVVPGHVPQGNGTIAPPSRKERRVDKKTVHTSRVVAPQSSSPFTSPLRRVSGLRPEPLNKAHL